MSNTRLYKLVLTSASLAGAALLLYRAQRQRQGIRCLIFDLDDTLWDTKAILDRATDKFHAHLAATYPRLAQRFPPEEYTKVFMVKRKLSNDYRVIRSMCLRHCAELTGYPPEQVIESGIREFELYRNDVEPYVFEGVLPMLRRLKQQGMRLGAVSNGTANVQHIDCFKGLFQFHFCPGNSGGMAKPDPTMFNKAIASSGLDPEQLLYVGDNYRHDVIGSLSVGMHACWVDDPNNTLKADADTQRDLEKQSEHLRSTSRSELRVVTLSKTVELEALLASCNRRLVQ